jgi:hypothetical protein
MGLEPTAIPIDYPPVSALDFSPATMGSPLDSNAPKGDVCGSLSVKPFPARTLRSLAPVSSNPCQRGIGGGPRALSMWRRAPASNLRPGEMLPELRLHPASTSRHVPSPPTLSRVAPPPSSIPNPKALQLRNHRVPQRRTIAGAPRQLPPRYGQHQRRRKARCSANDWLATSPPQPACVRTPSRWNTCRRMRSPPVCFTGNQLYLDRYDPQ